VGPQLTAGWVSLLRILWYSQSGDQPENNLAKFGYVLDMKVEKHRIFLYSWLSTITSYHKTLAIWGKKNSKYVEFGSFFSWNILCIGWNHIFHVENWQKLARNINTGWRAWDAELITTKICWEFCWNLKVKILSPPPTLEVKKSGYIWNSVTSFWLIFFCIWSF
jgi:hypothetical protein